MRTIFLLLTIELLMNTSYKQVTILNAVKTQSSQMSMWLDYARFNHSPEPRATQFRTHWRCCPITLARDLQDLPGNHKSQDLHFLVPRVGALLVAPQAIGIPLAPNRSLPTAKFSYLDQRRGLVGFVGLLQLAEPEKWCEKLGSQLPCT